MRRLPRDRDLSPLVYPVSLEVSGLKVHPLSSWLLRTCLLCTARFRFCTSYWLDRSKKSLMEIL